MAEVLLTNGGVALVDDSDLPLISRFKWCWVQRKGDTVRYAVATQKAGGKTLYMHKLILGASGRGRQSDHRNLNGLDNRRDNLRPATPTQNAQNRGAWRSKVCRYKGVGWDDECSKRYRARIRVDGRLISLGRHRCETAAALAYDRAALKHFGEFARPNILPLNRWSKSGPVDLPERAP